MRVQDWVRLIIPPVLAFGISKTAWIYAQMCQRDQPISPFQKAIVRYVSLFVLGMAYLVLWQYELDAAFHVAWAWQALLGLWAAAMVCLTVRSVRRNCASSEQANDNSSPRCN